MVRHALALGLLAAVAGCSSGSTGFQCLPCGSSDDCPGGQVCKDSYCVGDNDDPRRCPRLAGSTTAGSTSSGSTSSGSTSSGSSSGITSATGGTASSGGNSTATASSTSTATTTASGSTGGSGTSATSTAGSGAGSTGVSSSSGSTTGTTGGGSCDGGPADLYTVSNFEDGTLSVIVQQGRNGYWYKTDDATPGTATFDAVAGGAQGSCFAARFAGSGYTGWGAQVGFEPMWNGWYDASAFSGISFWARWGVDGGTPPALIVDVNDSYSSPSGGHCQFPDGGDNCYQPAHASVALSTSWTRYDLVFDGGFIPGAYPLHQAQLGAVTFTPSSCDLPFEVWVDTVRFMP